MIAEWPCECCGYPGYADMQGSDFNTVECVALERLRPKFDVGLAAGRAGDVEAGEEIAQLDHRGDVHQVVEQLEPGDFALPATRDERANPAGGGRRVAQRRCSLRARASRARLSSRWK